MRVKANYTIDKEVKMRFDKICIKKFVNKSQWLEGKMIEVIKNGDVNNVASDNKLIKDKIDLYIETYEKKIPSMQKMVEICEKTGAKSFIHMYENEIEIYKRFVEDLKSIKE